MSGYPGAQSRRWRAILLTAVLALAVGVGGGWLLFHRGKATAATPTSPCPDSQHDAASRDQAAACLVARYFALENAPMTERNAQLAQLVVQADLDSARKEYQPLESKVAVEYAAVAALKLTPNPNRPDTDYTGNAWVAFIDSYKDGSPPLSQWWMASFDLTWRESRWWLAGDGIGLVENATPPASGAARGGFGYGRGWVAVGHA